MRLWSDPASFGGSDTPARGQTPAASSWSGTPASSQLLPVASYKRPRPSRMNQHLNHLSLDHGKGHKHNLLRCVDIFTRCEKPGTTSAVPFTTGGLNISVICSATRFDTRSCGRAWSLHHVFRKLVNGPVKDLLLGDDPCHDSNHDPRNEEIHNASRDSFK